MRETNFDLLRIISMFMVVSLHYLSKGGVLLSFAQPFNGNTYLAYFIEMLSAPAVNLFVLLSGYFKTLADEKGVKKIHISLSHCKEYAVAQVVLED